jgi:SOS-response transcriptional repressor LexA
MRGLSPRQAEIYRFIQTYRAERGIAPTFREIASGAGLYLTTVMAHLRALKKKGFVTWNGGIARSVRVIE